MRSKPFSLFLLSLILGAGSASAMAQETAATIPDAFLGTYDLTYGDFSNGAGADYFSDGESVTLVLKSGGVLCVSGDQYTDPVFRNGNTAEAIWSSGSLEFAVSDLNGSFNEVNLMVNGSFAGQFSGSKTSSDVTCTGSGGNGNGGGSGPISLDTNAQNMLNLAENLFSNLLSNGSALKQLGGYTYRYYPGSGAYIGFKDGQVYVLGGPFGNALKSYGAVSKVTVSLQNYEASIQVDAGDLGGGGDGNVDITGVYDLTIDGDISIIAQGITLPPQAFNVVITNVVAPDPSDVDAIDNVITETLEGVSGIADLKVVVTNNTDSRITFSVSFTATQNGASVSMDLEYDYVK